ncbi:MAG TPA: hypothetical protein PLB52_00315 [Candidatus Moranbacteria bacterium]|nr:hypothetical protein [Candidatus Moranbacteria bacterium]
MTKKTIYLIASIVLFILLSVIARAGLELWYIKSLLKSGTGPSILGNGGYVWPMLTFILLLLGVAAGYFIGQKWWQIVYVEKRRISLFSKK